MPKQDETNWRASGIVLCPGRTPDISRWRNHRTRSKTSSQPRRGDKQGSVRRPSGAGNEFLNWSRWLRCAPPPANIRRASGAKNRVEIVALIFLALSFLAGCGRPSDPNGEATLTLGAYTTPREAYSKAIIPEFQKHWKAKTGQEVEFQESYQGSGAQSRAITSGFEADIVALSLESDVTG